MNAYSYDSMKHEVQLHADRLADEAAAARLARRSRRETAPTRLHGTRWLGRLQQVWAAQAARSGARASIARVA